MAISSSAIKTALVSALLATTLPVNGAGTGWHYGGTQHQQRNLRKSRNLQEFQTLCTPLDTVPATCPAASAPSCWAANSPAYCPPEHSFDALIEARTKEAETNAAGLLGSGYWFHLLEDKGAGYILSADSGHWPPQVYCCVTDPADLATTCAANLAGPVVIKADDGHSNLGVFAFSSGIASGVNSTELITQLDVTLEDVVETLQVLNPGKIIVEELIDTTSGDLPIEYKFHMFDGEVGAIDIVMNRGTECACYAVIDMDCNRLDQQGCFKTTGSAATDSDGVCTAINSALGLKRSGPVKMNLPLCTADLDVDPCHITQMAEVAVDISQKIGPYIRVDMFMDSLDNVRLQEYSTNHMGGYRYCASRVDPNTGCLDPCFLGEMWNDNASPGNELYGGDPTIPIPSALSTWSTLSADDQCSLMVGTAVPQDFTSTAVCTDKPTASPVSSPTATPTSSPTGATLSPTVPTVPLAVIGEEMTIPPDSPPFFPIAFDNTTSPIIFFPQSGPIGPCFGLNAGALNPDPNTTFTVTDPTAITNAHIGDGGGSPTFPGQQLIDVIGMAMSALPDFGLETVTQFVNEVADGSDFGSSTAGLESSILNGDYPPYPSTVMLPPDGSGVTNVACADPPLFDTSAPSASPTANPTVSATASPTTTAATSAPTSSPTASPTGSPTTPAATSAPTSSPTTSPTGSPTTPAATSAPTSSPTTSPTGSPTTPAATAAPTSSPTTSPTAGPTVSPTASPTASPTVSPTTSPTVSPTGSPTSSPTGSPTTSAPTQATSSPTSAWVMGNQQADPHEWSSSVTQTSGGMYNSLPLYFNVDTEQVGPCFCMNEERGIPSNSNSYEVADPTEIVNSIFGIKYTSDLTGQYAHDYPDVLEKAQRVIRGLTESEGGLANNPDGIYTARQVQFAIWAFTDNSHSGESYASNPGYFSQALIDAAANDDLEPVSTTLMLSHNTGLQNFLCLDDDSPAGF